MSYRLTEAERKHIATIEDSKIWISGNYENNIPAYDIYISDNDKLNGLTDSNFHIRLPKYKFQWDDALARLHLVDVAHNDLEIYTDGLSNQGIGWRYTLSTEKTSGTEYVTALKFTRDNDNNSYILDISKLGDTTIKSLKVDETTYLSGVLTVEDDANFNSDITVSGKTTLRDFLQAEDADFNSNVRIDGTLDVFKKSSFYSGVLIQEGLTSYGETRLHGDTYITSDGNLTVAGKVTGKKDASFAGRVSAKEFNALSGITAGTDITAGNNITAKNDLTVENNAYIFGNLIIKKNLGISGNLDIDKDLYISGDFYLSGKSFHNDDEYFNKNIYVSGDTGISGSLYLYNDLYVSGKAEISGDTYLHNNLYVSGGTEVSGDIYLYNDLFVSGNTEISGDTHLHSDLTVDKNTYISGDTYISGNTTISGDTHIESNLFVDQNAYISGDTHLHSNLFVDENTYISGDTHLHSNLFVDQNTFISGDTHLHSNLFVDENTYISGDTVINNNLTVSGVSHFSGDVYYENNIWISGDLYASGNMHIPDDFDVDGTLTTNYLIVNETTYLNGTVNISGDAFLEYPSGYELTEYSIINKNYLDNEHRLVDIIDHPDKSIIEDKINYDEIIYKETLPIIGNWNGIAYGNERFVAVGASNSNKAAVGFMTRHGIKWEETILPNNSNWQSVTFGNGLFVAITDSQTVAYSSDGINWTETGMRVSASVLT